MTETFVVKIVESFMLSMMIPLLFFMPMRFVLSVFRKMSNYDS